MKTVHRMEIKAEAKCFDWMTSLLTPFPESESFGVRFKINYFTVLSLHTNNSHRTLHETIFLCHQYWSELLAELEPE